MVSENDVRIDDSPISGNGLFAQRDILPGDLITMVHRPLIGVLDDLEDACSNCFKSKRSSAAKQDVAESGAGNMKACTGCKVVRYCSKECQKESWKRHHKAECAGWGRLMQSNVSIDKLPSAVRATIQVLWMKHLRTVSDAVWFLFLRMDSHIEELKATGSPRYEEIKLMSLAITAYSGGKVQFDQDLASEILGKILSNSLTIVTPYYDPIGLCLDPIPCTANHSCDPNAFAVMDGPQLSLRAFRKIKKNEEICISYIDNTDPFFKRQRELKERFYFDCACPKCSTDSALLKGEEDKSFHKALDLQAEMFSQYETVQALSNADEALRIAQSCLRNCDKSGLVPPTSQPYAALLQESFVNYVTVDRYIDALRVGARVHYDIDPILYPEHHHPIRVVHCWSLVSVCLHILDSNLQGSIRELEDNGIKLPSIICALLLRLHVESPKSHGMFSAFNKMVAKAKNEMTALIGGGHWDAAESILVPEMTKEYEKFRKWNESNQRK